MPINKINKKTPKQSPETLTVCQVAHKHGALLVAARVLLLVGADAQQIAAEVVLVQRGGHLLRLLRGRHIDERDQRRQRRALGLEQLAAVGLAESDAQHLGVRREQRLQLGALGRRRQIADKHGHAGQTIGCAEKNIHTNKHQHCANTSLAPLRT